MMITRYGVKEVLLSAVLFCGAAAALIALSARYDTNWFLLPVIVPIFVFGWVLWFFRDPFRTIPVTPGVIVSPADGTVTHVDEAHEPDFIKGTALRCSIFMSIFDPHINRVPVTGTVSYMQFMPGTFYDARNVNSLTKNQNQDVGLITSELGLPQKILVRQSTGAIARRIVCPVSTGMEYRRGDKYGMIKFGSRATIFISQDKRVEWAVKVGDTVKAGETILARVKLPDN